jgi:hypothetical protein
MLIRLLILAAAALLPIAPARAQNVVADIQRIASVLQKAGYKAQIEGKGDRRYIATGAGGTSFTIPMLDCNLLGGTARTSCSLPGSTASLRSRWKR